MLNVGVSDETFFHFIWHMEVADGFDGSSLRLNGAEARWAQANSGHEANHRGRA